MSLDYAYTCPKIDKAISSAKSDIDRFLDDMISEMCPFIDASTRNRISSEYGERLYSEIKDMFESVRETNEDMRSVADNQIESLKDDIDTLENKVSELEHQIEVLNR